MAWIKVGRLSDLADGRGMPFILGGRRLAIFRVGDDVFAIENRCPHRGFPLHDGSLNGLTVRCRTHGSCFDLESGAVVRGPAPAGVRTYPVRVDGDGVAVEVSP